MCGLTGYVGTRQAAPILLDSLKRLEYRGYDSCGVAVVNGREVFVKRRVGHIDPFRTEVLGLAPVGQIGIGHTRWATHGRADLKNAHPLMSCDGEIMVVHNGIIENAEELRSHLVAEGHGFASDTDSEVIPHLLEEAMSNGCSFDAAFQGLPAKLRGSYAILVARKGTDELYALRRDSALVIGVGDGELYPASDIPSFLPLTSKVIFVPEGECLVLSSRGIESLEGTNGSTRRVQHGATPEVVNLKQSHISKGDFEHYMIKEIMDQIDSLQNGGPEQDPRILREVAEQLRTSKDVWLVAAGSSFHACLYGELLFSTIAKRHTRAYIASEFEFREHLLTPDSMVIAVSQSGETADTIQAARMAKARGAKLVAVTNEPLSKLARLAGAVIPLHSGTELSVAATKSYTSQLVVFHKLAHHLEHTEAKGNRELWQARDALLNLTSSAAREHTLGLAHDLKDAKSIFLVGRGANRVSALEAALKLKEVAGMHAEAFPGGEMKHGPLALVEEGTPVVFFYDEESQPRSELAASEVHTRGGRIFSIGPRALRLSENHIKAQDAGMATPVVQIVPFQLLAYELAKLKALDPDHPRNLAKSVTVI